MKRIVIIAVLAFSLLTTINAHAVPVTLIEQGDTWKYRVLQQDLWSNWNTVSHSSVDWALPWQSGQAAFGNPYSGGLSYHTAWAASTDLALQKEVNVTGVFSGTLTLNVASDNGFLVFVNNQQVAKFNAEGYTSYWEYTIAVDPSLFNIGTNTIQVLAEDHGGATFFDMKLAGDMRTVPEPSTLLLLGGGLVGLVGWRRRRK